MLILLSQFQYFVIEVRTNTLKIYILIIYIFQFCAMDTVVVGVIELYQYWKYCAQNMTNDFMAELWKHHLEPLLPWTQQV